MDAFNPLWIDRYSLTELLAYIACGYTLDDFKMCGATDETLRDLSASLGTAVPVNDDLIYKAANDEGTAQAFERYCELMPQGKHVHDSNAWKERIGDKVETMVQQLIDDMRLHPQDYPASCLRLLLLNNLPDRTRQDIINGTIYVPPLLKDLMLGDYTIPTTDIAEAVKPDGLSPNDWWVIWFQSPYAMPLVTSREMSRMVEGYRDIVMLGLPRCGRTSMIASILNYTTLFMNGRYEPHVVKGQDMSYFYYKALRDIVPARKFPASPGNELLCFVHFKATSRKVTLIDHDGSMATMLAQSMDSQNSRESWNTNALCACLHSNNPKTLLLLIDCQQIMAGDTVNQSLMLEKMVQAICCDGPDERKPDKGCSMSHVKKLAVVFTKADVLGGNPTTENWIPQVDAIFREHFATLNALLLDACRRYGINSEASNNIYMLIHSIGRPNVGDCFTPDLSTTAGVAKFIFNY